MLLVKALWRRDWFVCRVLYVDWRRGELVTVMVVSVAYKISVVLDICSDNVLSNTHHAHVRHNIRTRNRIVYTELSKRISEAESPIS